MMISYYLVATLATLYAAVISLDSIATFVKERYNPRQKFHRLIDQTPKSIAAFKNKYKPWHTLHSLFEQTLHTFLETSLLFSVSMLLAAIYRFISASEDPTREDNTFIYSQINVATVSIFSVFPPLVLHFSARRLRRERIRAILWFLVIAFMAILTVLYYKWRKNHPIYKYFEDDQHFYKEFDLNPKRLLWLSFCDLNSKRLLQVLDNAIIFAQVVFILNLPRWIHLLFIICNSRKKECHGSQDPVTVEGGHFRSALQKMSGKHLRRLSILFRALNIILCCATMWLLLIILTIIGRHNADAMGPESMDRRLSVGQVLAVATFVPIIVDIGAIIIGKRFFLPSSGLEKSIAGVLCTSPTNFSGN